MLVYGSDPKQHIKSESVAHQDRSEYHTTARVAFPNWNETIM